MKEKMTSFIVIHWLSFEIRFVPGSTWSTGIAPAYDRRPLSSREAGSRRDRSLGHAAPPSCVTSFGNEASVGVSWLCELLLDFFKWIWDGLQWLQTVWWHMQGRRAHTSKAHSFCLFLTCLIERPWAAMWTIPAWYRISMQAETRRAKDTASFGEPPFRHRDEVHWGGCILAKLQQNLLSSLYRFVRVSICSM